MKKYILLLPFLLIMFLSGCSADSDTAAANTDGTGGSLAVFVLKGNYLYAVDHSNLNVFSLLNEAEPVKVNTINVGFNIETLSSEGDYLYIGSTNGMFIYSVENPEAPQMLSAVQHFTACDPVIATETHAFVTLHSTTWCGNNINALEIYDIADRENPLLVHRRNLTEPKGIGLYNNYLFVCDDEIKVFDVTDPEAPALVTSINRYCFDVIIKDDTLFAIGNEGVYRYSLNPSDITAITEVSSITF
ncbi:hypothetical protein [Flavobacterium coralii]|uniref:LVIVD repeat-containing protein n=1 Tax=Flavobacterium coralii TaxID=2838017 RepID=UPI0026ADDD9C|tara:strand:- start:1862 stop:2599 length:738 start_codon:yes stop_codon:yes gene_type:complete